MPSAAVIPKAMAMWTPANTSASTTITIAIMSKWPSMTRSLNLHRRGGRFIRLPASYERAGGVHPVKDIRDDDKDGADQDDDAGRKGRHPQRAFALIFAACPGMQRRLEAAPHNQSEEKNTEHGRQQLCKGAAAHPEPRRQDV